ncbi:uncharacterized protein LOC124259104 [Haliotis rubra]|uniref:uncharacterized protein LOC124259104 n=1 Tax=Haliotis rubra TaxID=36100 RepID=UPI001EE5C1D0|nr:uncharacterized protein LOC124259104 [Haliotis rubra]XP_046549154.1 uncharacterized protein LOC124259104 [Haliotis rubra]
MKGPGLSSCLSVFLCLAVCLQFVCTDGTQPVDAPLSRQKRFDFDFDKILQGLKAAGTFVKTATNLLGQGNSTFGKFINRLPFLDLPDAKMILGRFEDMMTKDDMTPVQKDLAHRLMDAMNHSISIKEQFQENSGQKQFDVFTVLAGLRTAGTAAKTITNVLGFGDSAFGRFINQVPFLDVPDAKNVLGHVENMMKTEEMTQVNMDRAHQLSEALNYSIQAKEQLEGNSGEKQSDLLGVLAGLRTAGTVAKTVTNALGFRKSAFGRFINQVPFLDLPDAKNVLEHVENMMKTEEMTQVKMDRAHMLMEVLEYSVQVKEQLEGNSGSSTLLLSSTLMMLPVMCAVGFTM